MFPRSTKFDAAIKKGHKVASRVTIIPFGGTGVSFAVESGNINAEDEPIRRRCSLKTKIVDSTITPAQVGDLVSPTSEFRPERGIHYDDGTSEYLSLGVFGISDVQMDYDGEELQMFIDGYDRARKIIRARLNNEYPIASGTNIKTGLQDLIQNRFPAVQLSSVWSGFSTTQTFPAVVLSTGDDPWEFARKVALDGLGCDIFFDNQGQLTIQEIVNPAYSSPVWTYAEGSEAMILAANKRLNDEGVYNHVVVTGEHPEGGAPVRAEAYDNNPSSPTYIYGGLGDVTYFQQSDLIKTTPQAQTAADARLNKELGESESVRFVALPHPAHDVGDIVQIVTEKLKVNSVYVLDKFNISLGYEQAMNASTRKRRV